ncbi:hypothetical protein HPB47_006312 [Ixodes persulcatus]|uniref:Uncharacterized protein n=1 Tax=Ixodes persulcatus TaxID=34615 RepID=A0AC60PAI0_IXOPE|nr:hypothetical protein HPB47_006312 [Ixodes persulcatus]
MFLLISATAVTAEFRNLTQTTLTLKGRSTSSRKARGPALANREDGPAVAIGQRRPSRLPRGSGGALKSAASALEQKAARAPLDGSRGTAATDRPSWPLPVTAPDGVVRHGSPNCVKGKTADAADHERSVRRRSEGLGNVTEIQQPCSERTTPRLPPCLAVHARSRPAPLPPCASCRKAHHPRSGGSSENGEPTNRRCLEPGSSESAAPPSAIELQPRRGRLQIPTERGSRSLRPGSAGLGRETTLTAVKRAASVRVGRGCRRTPALRRSGHTSSIDAMVSVEKGPPSRPPCVGLAAAHTTTEDATDARSTTGRAFSLRLGRPLLWLSAEAAVDSPGSQAKTGAALNDDLLAELRANTLKKRQNRPPNDSEQEEPPSDPTPANVTCNRCDTGARPTVQHLARLARSQTPRTTPRTGARRT